MAGCRYYHDCFSCPFPDCIIDNPLSVHSGISRSDLIADDNFIDGLFRSSSGSSFRSGLSKSLNSYYLANRDKCIESAKQYYRLHREECIARSKARYYANRDELKARALARYYRLKSQKS